MLTTSFFTSCIERLRDQFGANKISNHKANLIYRRVKYWNDNDFSDLVDHMIGNFSHAPKLDDFFNRNVTQDKYECSVCNGAGLLTRNYSNRVGSYAFRCSCRNGDRYSKSFPTWQETRKMIDQDLHR